MAIGAWPADYNPLCPGPVAKLADAADLKSALGENRGEGSNPSGPIWQKKASFFAAFQSGAFEMTASACSGVEIRGQALLSSPVADQVASVNCDSRSTFARLLRSNALPCRAYFNSI